MTQALTQDQTVGQEYSRIVEVYPLYAVSDLCRDQRLGFMFDHYKSARLERSGQPANAKADSTILGRRLRQCRRSFKPNPSFVTLRRRDVLTSLLAGRPTRHLANRPLSKYYTGLARCSSCSWRVNRNEAEKGRI